MCHPFGVLGVFFCVIPGLGTPDCHLSPLRGCLPTADCCPRVNLEPRTSNLALESLG